MFLYHLQQEFVYETPKHLIHRSRVGKTPRSAESFKSEKEEKGETVTIKKYYLKHESNNPGQAKRQKLDIEDYEGENIIEEHPDSEIMYELEATNTDDEKVEEILYVTNEPAPHETPAKKSEEMEQTVTSKEEKFISAVYPQFKGRTKMELIDEIFDLQRRNELLQVKVKTYENTINKLL